MSIKKKTPVWVRVVLGITAMLLMTMWLKAEPEPASDTDSAKYACMYKTENLYKLKNLEWQRQPGDIIITSTGKDSYDVRLNLKANNKFGVQVSATVECQVTKTHKGMVSGSPVLRG